MSIPTTALRLGSIRIHRTSDPSATVMGSAYRVRIVVRGAVEYVDGGRRELDEAGSVRLIRSSAAGIDVAQEGAETFVVDMERGDLPRGSELMAFGSSWRAPAGPISNSMIAVMQGVFADPPRPRSDGAHRMERVLMPLIAAALDSAHRPIDHVDRSAALHERALGIIDDRLRDPELRLDSLAAAVGTSSRTLQRALSARDTSASVLIRDRRLDALAAELRGPSAEGVRNLAGQYGFSSAHYVARAFRARFGCSMSEYRNSRRG